MADSEARPVLGPAGNKNQRAVSARKPGSKPMKKLDVSQEEDSLEEEKKAATSLPPLKSPTVPSILRRQGSLLLHSNLSLSASCSSDASSDSFRSRASTGRIYRTSSDGFRRRQTASKPKIKAADGGSESLPDGVQPKKRCAWVTPSTGTFFFLQFQVISFDSG